MKSPNTARRAEREPTSRLARRGGIAGAVLLLAALVFGGLAVPGTATAAPAPVAPTVVSLTFDDGFASQWTAREQLRQHDLHGTFYIPSGLIGLQGRMTVPQLQAIQADGNEIAGHTVNHFRLPARDPAENMRQICDDRVALTRDGLAVSSFAYPYADSSQLIEQIVKDCGYNSARSEEGLSAGGTCATCPYAESMPPADPYLIRTATPVVNTTKVAEIEQQISDAQSHGGGWVPVVFHEVCDGCSDMGIKPADLSALLTWLRSQAGNGLAVRTMNEVVGGPLRHTVAGPVDGRPDGQLVNPSLEAGADGTSECWQRSGNGVNTAAWSKVRTAHSGSWAEQVTVGSLTSGNQKLIVTEDSGSCSPAVKPGTSYTLSAWYMSTAPTRMVAFYRTPTGSWKYWAESPPSGSSEAWQKLSWQTPAIPADATRLSFGLQASGAGTLTMDDYEMTVVSSSSPVLAIGGAVLLTVIVIPTLGFVGWTRLRRRSRR